MTIKHNQKFVQQLQRFSQENCDSQIQLWKFYGNHLVFIQLSNQDKAETKQANDTNGKSTQNELTVYSVNTIHLLLNKRVSILGF